MIKRIIKLISGVTLSSFAITCVLKSNLGAFATTAANVTIGNWLHISIGTAGFLVELIILALVIYLKEGLSITAIVNMTYGSYMIDVFNKILPTSPFMVLGLLFIGFGWALSAQAGLGDTNNNLLMNGLLKKTGKSIGMIRGIQECSYMIIGLLGSNQVTLFTVILSLFLGYLLQFEYKLIKYDPTKIKHSYLIKAKGKCRNEVTELAISKESKE